MILKVGIVTATDRGSRGEYDFLTGETVQQVLAEFFKTTFEYIHKVVPDEQDQLEAALIDLSDNAACALIITAGGTGPAPRDVTPDATEAVCRKMLPGFGEKMRLHSLQFVSTAFLSRQTAGIRNRTLIINMPGKPRSIKQCMEAIAAGIPHTLLLLGHEKPELRQQPSNEPTH